MTFTIANIVTLARLFLSPLFLLCILASTEWVITTGVVIFIIAAWSDWLDGYLARRYGQVSDHGVFLDPLADKVLTTMAFIALFLLDVIPLWMVIVVVLRDFGTTALRSIADDKGTVMQTSQAAKAKTFLQLVFISWTLVLYWIQQTWNTEAHRLWAHNALYSTWTTAVMLLITLLSLYTLASYIIRNKELFRRG